MQIEFLRFDSGEATPAFRMTPTVFRDQRGTFVELFRESTFRMFGGPGGLLDLLDGLSFVQQNLSQSRPYTLRGLHFQTDCLQGKLMRCVEGSAYQVMVDVRTGSPTLGKFIGTLLDAVSHRAVYVPPGFANGFLTLTHGATMLYETTAYFDAAKERSLAYDDPALAIDWPLGPGAAVAISAKDRTAPRLDAIEPWRAPVAAPIHEPTR